MEQQKVIGTSCFNCLYISKKEVTVDSSELIFQGGIDPKTQEEMKRAEKADLITLPSVSKFRSSISHVP